MSGILDEYFGPAGPPIDNEGAGTLHNVPTTRDGGGVSPEAGVRFTANPTVTGFSGGKPGRRILVYGPATLAHENAGSLAGNRIATTTGANVAVAANGVQAIVWDDAIERWKLVGGGAPGGGAAEGRETLTFADANITLSASQAEVAILKLAGANTVTRDLIFAAPAEGTSRVYDIEMGVTGAGVRLTTGTGSTWTIPAASGGALHTAVVTPSGITVSGPSGSGAGEVQRRTSAGFVTGLAIGTAGQILKVNAGATDIEWGAAGSGSTPTGTGLRKVVAGVEDAAASLLVNADVDAAAAIAGTKVAPDFGAQTIATTGGVTPGFVSFGTPVPAAGQFRSAYGSASWRGHNSVANDSYLVHYEGDGLLIGTGPAYTGTTQAGSVGVYAFGTVGLGIGGSTYIYATNAGVIEMWKPRIGSGTGASPYASDGETPLAGDADATLTASQYSRHAIDISGTTATRTFTFPHPAAQDSSYKKLIINRTANSHTISTGTGTTATVPAGVLKYVWFSPSGADAA